MAPYDVASTIRQALGDGADLRALLALALPEAAGLTPAMRRTFCTAALLKAANAGHVVGPASILSPVAPLAPFSLFSPPLSPLTSLLPLSLSPLLSPLYSLSSLPSPLSSSLLSPFSLFSSPILSSLPGSHILPPLVSRGDCCPPDVLRELCAGAVARGGGAAAGGGGWCRVQRQRQRQHRAAPRRGARPYAGQCVPATSGQCQATLSHTQTLTHMRASARPHTLAHSLTHTLTHLRVSATPHTHSLAYSRTCG